MNLLFVVPDSIKNGVTGESLGRRLLKAERHQLPDGRVGADLGRDVGNLNFDPVPVADQGGTARGRYANAPRFAVSKRLLLEEARGCAGSVKVGRVMADDTLETVEQGFLHHVSEMIHVAADRLSVTGNTPQPLRERARNIGGVEGVELQGGLVPVSTEGAESQGEGTGGKLPVKGGFGKVKSPSLQDFSATTDELRTVPPGADAIDFRGDIPPGNILPLPSSRLHRLNHGGILPEGALPAITNRLGIIEGGGR